MPALPFTIANPWPLAPAALLTVLTITVAARRRIALHRLTSALAILSLLLFALATGGLTYHRPATAEVVVMVDLSPSTRGAAFRNPATLDQRIQQLLGDTPHHVLYFADRNVPTPPPGSTLPDLAADHTTFAPPAAVAVVLFTDARFPAPTTAPPTFIVADPNLDRDAGDAAVTRLESRGRQLAVSLRNAGQPRRVSIEAATTQPAAEVEPGQFSLTRQVKPTADSATAALNKGDLWPENDALSLPLAPPMRTQRWFVSETRAAPPGDWLTLKPADLARRDAAAYLAAGVIVLDNLPAADLPQPQLEQYVRDLGGALVVAGGDRAFAPGDYSGTALEALSPLASVPPTPTVHWMLLADSSGSMSESAGASTRWQLAARSITALLPNLPPEDPVSVGSFAADLRWWTTGKTARQAAAIALPPAGVGPGGPTNLQPALERIVTESAGGMAAELLVVSDADTVIDRPADLAARLKQKNIRLHVLAIGDGQGLGALDTMTKSTGGTLTRQLDPRQWSAGVLQLFKKASPDRLIPTPTTITFASDLAAIPSRPTKPWNRTWLKPAATELARTTHANETLPMSARWTLGSGEVIACAFAPTAAELETIAKLIARPPRDPRYAVTWDAGPRLTVRIDAADRGKYLNGEQFKLELTDEDAPSKSAAHDVPQTAPGRYELSLPAPRTRSFASLHLNDRIIDRIALPARYAPEFDDIGNDYDAMRALANRTGGHVVDRSLTEPIEFKFPRRDLDLAPWLTLAAAITLALGLARWRYG
jgi:hypothetical protein